MVLDNSAVVCCILKDDKAGLPQSPALRMAEAFGEAHDQTRDGAKPELQSRLHGRPAIENCNSRKPGRELCNATVGHSGPLQ